MKLTLHKIQRYDYFTLPKNFMQYGSYGREFYYFRIGRWSLRLYI